MANRVFKYARAKRRKIAIQPIRGAPAICSFCGGDLARSHLNSASKVDNAEGTGPLAVICAFCIERLEPLCRLMAWYQEFFRRQENNLWASLSSVIQRRLVAEHGSAKAKAIVCDLLLRVLKRAFAVIGGYRANGFAECPRTGVPLHPPRIAIVCSNDPSDCIIRLVVAGANAVGLPTHAVSLTDMVLEDPVRALKLERCNGDPAILAIGLIVVDEYVAITDDVGVVYVLETASGLPGDIEIVTVPG
jgi:hypothetical protein